MVEQPFDLLSIRNETFLREISYHDELESTNSTANQLAVDGCDSPLLVLTPRQTSGRGLGTNAWSSSDGALTFSIILDLPMLGPERLSSFSLTVGLAICQTLEQFAPLADLAIKWPNDVYMNDRKVCGILTEKPIPTESRLVVGIGINVNNSLRAASDDLRMSATSLVDELGSEVSANQILIQCLQQLELRMRDHVHQQQALLDQWRAYCLLTGRNISLDLQGRTVNGLCRGIDEDGALLIDDGTSVQRCVSGSVTQF